MYHRMVALGKRVFDSTLILYVTIPVGALLGRKKIKPPWWGGKTETITTGTLPGLAVKG